MFIKRQLFAYVFMRLDSELCLEEHLTSVERTDMVRNLLAAFIVFIHAQYNLRLDRVVTSELRNIFRPKSYSKL